jgi:mannose-1-phosphate guanylyltransferase
LPLLVFGADSAKDPAMRHAVILAGGGGTRLWPASRRTRPKQLMLTPGGESLVGSTARRLAPLGALGLVAGGEHAEAVRASLAAEGQPLSDAAVMVEPVGRSTAAAVGLAAIHARAGDPDAVLGVFPADHYVADPDGFRRVAARAFDLAESEPAIVTIGVQPSWPDPGFGYLALGPRRADGAAPVVRFVEKPSAAAAERLIAAGCLWNGGMFFARADHLLAELRRHLPATGEALDAIGAALAGGGRAAAEKVTAERYPALEAISFDHAVMEKTDRVLAVDGQFGWSDVGSWPALADWREPDDAGNVRFGAALTLGARGNLVVTDEGTVTVLIGVDDLVVVRAGDAVLVVPRQRAHEVKDAVAALAAAGLERYL